MWKETISLKTNKITCESIYTILSDVNNWNKWDSEIERTRLDGEVSLNKNRILKPKGGPETKMTIIDFKKPNLFVDKANLILAQMITKHTFEDQENGFIKITFEIEIQGFLGFLWKNIIGKGQINGFKKQIESIITYANEKQ